MIYGIDYSTRTMNGLSMEPQEFEPPTCDSCGQPAEHLTRCVWDEDLMVGACCEAYTDHRCPDCGSDSLEFREYDYGTCSETGYRDAGVRAICQDCGCNCDERDTEVKIGPLHAIQPALFPELERKPARVALPAVSQKEVA